jgi:hypothetical protein
MKLDLAKLARRVVLVVGAEVVSVVRETVEDRLRDQEPGTMPPDAAASLQRLRSGLAELEHGWRLEAAATAIGDGEEH